MADRYEFLPRPDREEAVVQEIEQQELDFQQAFYDFVYATNDHGWDRREHIETLDGRFETYVLYVGGDRTRRAMLTRGVSDDTYHYLGLTRSTTDAERADDVYRAACKAHGLDAPAREPNPDPH